MRDILIASTVVLATLVLVHTRPHYIGCQDSVECGSMACCVIGTGRFSIPECKPLLGIGDTCSVQSYFRMNKTNRYPDNAEVALTNVHELYCPCEAGLICGEYFNNRGGGVGGGVGKNLQHSVCYDPSMFDDINSIANSVYH